MHTLVFRSSSKKYTFDKNLPLALDTKTTQYRPFSLKQKGEARDP